jgi:hypothetical protein
VTTTPYAAIPAPPEQRYSPAASLLVVWLPVVAWAFVGGFLVLANEAKRAGLPADDLASGLSWFYSALVVCAVVVLALVSLVLALVFSFTPGDARFHGGLGGAIYTAVTGGGLVAFVAWLSTTSLAIDSPTADDRFVWLVAAGLAALVPLGAAVAVGSGVSARRCP